MFFEVEPLLVEKLTTDLGSLVKAVLTTADLAGVTEMQQVTPAVFVVFQTHDIAEEDPDMIWPDEYWYVIPAARNAKDVQSGAAARAAVAPILNGVYSSLKGWVPPGLGCRVKPVRPPKALINNGFIYVPTLWKVRINPI